MNKSYNKRFRVRWLLLLAFLVWSFGVQAKHTNVVLQTNVPDTSNYYAVDELGDIANVKAKVEIENVKITVYNPTSDNGKWGYSTATGIKSKHLKTCAVDPSVIPLGSTVYVNGLELIAIDTGNLVKGNVVDVFYDGTEEESKRWVKEFGTNYNIYIGT